MRANTRTKWLMSAVAVLAAIPLVPLLAMGAGALLILAMPITDELGFGLGLLVLAQHVWRARHVAPSAA